MEFLQLFYSFLFTILILIQGKSNLHIILSRQLASSGDTLFEVDSSNFESKGVSSGHVWLRLLENISLYFNVFDFKRNPWCSEIHLKFVING